MTREDEERALSWSAQTGMWARWGWLVALLALGAALILSALSNYRSARNDSASVIGAQAQVLRDAIFSSLRGARGHYPASLDSVLAVHEDAGLRYAALVNAGGAILSSGGSPVAPLPALANAPPGTQLTRLGTRQRAVFTPTPRRSERADSLRPPPPSLVIEFEPVLAVEMIARAERSLIIAGVVAAVLIAAGMVSWRLSRRLEREERRSEAQRRLVQLGEMSAVLAHEIRNPLASLKGHAQLLTERLAADSPERRKADRVVEEATRLEALTSDLLDFARSGPMDLRPVDPAALLRDSAAELPDAGIVIDTGQAPERWLLDERRFGQAVLVNLLRNAVQATPAAQPPRARAALEHDQLHFEVRDFGPGLAEGSEQRIFDPFFTTRTTGNGLGLAVARRIVELHGGRIEAANAPGGGALFRVVLPARGS